VGLDWTREGYLDVEEIAGVHGANSDEMDVKERQTQDKAVEYSKHITYRCDTTRRLC